LDPFEPLLEPLGSRVSKRFKESAKAPLALLEGSSMTTDRQFGGWKFDRESLTLMYPVTRNYEYEIDLEKMCCSAEILDWIFQIRGKSWVKILRQGPFAPTLWERVIRGKGYVFSPTL